MTDAGEPKGPFHRVVRLGVWSAGILYGVAVSLWLLALSDAMAPAPPILVTFVPALETARVDVTVRVAAYDPSGRRALPMNGTVAWEGGAPVPIVDHHAHLLPSASPTSAVNVDVVVGGRKTRQHIPFRPRSAVPPPKLQVKPWTDEVVRGGFGQPTLFPEYGRVSSFAASRVVTIDAMQIEIQEVSPSVLHVDVDGRQLALRRDNFLAAAVPLVQEGAKEITLSVTSSARQPLYVDLYLDRRLVSLQVIIVDAGAHEVPLKLPAWAKATEGQLWSVVVGASPISRQAAQMTHTIVSPTVDDALTHVLELYRTAASEDPGAAALKQFFDDERAAQNGPSRSTTIVLRALLARVGFDAALKPASLSAVRQREAAKRDRAAQVAARQRPFRAASLAFSLLAIVLAVGPAVRSRTRRRRVLEEDEGGNAAEHAPVQGPLARFSGPLLAVLALAVALGLLGILDWILRYVAEGGAS